MNDKIKELLENAEQTDSLAKNKWRIENREQLRKERKEKLKELMEKDKQQTAVDSIIELCQELLANHYSISHDAVCSEVIKFCQEQAKEMEKQRIIEFTNEWFEEYQCGLDNFKNPEQYYEQTYGGGEQ
jgi:hypothetical protein